MVHFSLVRFTEKIYITEKTIKKVSLGAGDLLAFVAKEKGFVFDSITF